MTSINFPTHPRLNPTGQFNKLVLDGSKWSIKNTTTNQSRELTKDDRRVALEAVVTPLMS